MLFFPCIWLYLDSLATQPPKSNLFTQMLDVWDIYLGENGDISGEM